MSVENASQYSFEPSTKRDEWTIFLMAVCAGVTGSTCFQRNQMDIIFSLVSTPAKTVNVSHSEIVKVLKACRVKDSKTSATLILNVAAYAIKHGCLPKKLCSLFPSKLSSAVCETIAVNSHQWKNILPRSPIAACTCVLRRILRARGSLGFWKLIKNLTPSPGSQKHKAFVKLPLWAISVDKCFKISTL